MQDVAPAESARFCEAMAEHRSGLCRFLRGMRLPSHRIEDIAQTTFLIMLEALPRIGAGSERAFLYSTAVRLVYGLRRRAQREVTSSELDQDTSPYPSPDDLAQQKWAREVLDAVLENIEGESRSVFVSFEVEGCTIPEIANALSIPTGTAVCRLRRARRQFRALVRGLDIV